VAITDKETEISDNEFYGCTSLQNVTIGEGVTTIGQYAFSGCSSLKNFAFGSQVKTIGQEAFSDCSAITEIDSRANTPPACGSQALDDINKWECKLYVPEGTLPAYQNADQWKDFFFSEEGSGTAGDVPGTETTPRCAKPTISVVDGKLSFECETEDVTFKSSYTYKNGSTEAEGKDLIIAGTTTCHVMVYAMKDGYLNSEVATADVELYVGKKGDADGNGVVDIADAVHIVNFIVGKINSLAPRFDSNQTNPE